MPTQDYRNAKGEKISGNTTIIGSNLGWKGPRLMGWQRKTIMAQMCAECLKNFKDPKDITADAANAGTLAHAMIEADIKNHKFPNLRDYNSELVKKVDQAFNNFCEWRNQTNLKLITMEVPCVSEKWQFGTTVDIVCAVADRLSIVEVKTSNDLYPDFLIQVAAQVEAWNETQPKTLSIEACHILKLGKDEATFSHHYYHPDVLKPAFEAFKDLRDLHDKQKILSKLI